MGNRTLYQIDSEFNRRGKDTSLPLPTIGYWELFMGAVLSTIAIPLQAIADIGSFASRLKRPCDEWLGRRP